MTTGGSGCGARMMAESRLLLHPGVAAVIPAIDEVTAIGPLVVGLRNQAVC